MVCVVKTKNSRSKISAPDFILSSGDQVLAKSLELLITPSCFCPLPLSARTLGRLSHLSVPFLKRAKTFSL